MLQQHFKTLYTVKLAKQESESTTEVVSPVIFNSADLHDLESSCPRHVL